MEKIYLNMRDTQITSKQLMPLNNLPTYLSQIATARLLHLYVDLYGSSLEY